MSRDPATNRAAVTLPAWTWHAATLLIIVVLAATQQWVAAAIMSGLAIVGVVLVRRDRHGGDD